MDKPKHSHKLMIIEVLLLLLCISQCQSSDSFYNPYYDAGFGHDDYEGYLNDFAGNWGSRSRRLNQPTCVNIPANMSLCQGIGYNRMRLPNLLEHDTLDEVLQQSAEWNVLANRQCHPDTKLFLCSLFSPVCLDQLIYPCRYVLTLLFFFVAKLVQNKMKRVCTCSYCCCVCFSFTSYILKKA